MALLKITSENSNLSFLLKKNPNTQLANKELFQKNTKTYKISGWYPDLKTPTSFAILAKKLPVNRKDASFEYLDYSSESSPEGYLIMIKEMLRDIFNKQDTDYDTHPVTFTFNVKGNQYKLPNNFGTVVYLNDNSLCHQVTIKSDTFHEGINLVALYCYIQYIFSHDFYFIDEQYEKFLTQLTKYTQNYTLLNRFLSVINSVQKFTNYSTIVDNNTPFTFNFGNNAHQRLEALTYLIKSIPDSENKVLLDIGAGEGTYIKVLNKNVKEIIAVEKDPEVFESLQWFVNKRELTNVITVNQDIFDYLNNQSELNQDVQIVLCTEVLEHIPKEDALALMRHLVDQKIEHIVITVPNKDFNIYYGMEKHEVRIEDHLWEPTNKEFLDFVSDVQTKDYNITVSPIGNLAKATHTHPTLLAHFQLKKV